MNVSLSKVTWLSFIASKRALCVLGEDRFISSAKMMLLKIGPERKENSAVDGLKTKVPRISEGSISEVNCILEYPRSSALDSALARVVLPTPGTSSRRRCPFAIREVIVSSTTSLFPTKTFSTSAIRFSIRPV